jgi:hypothetical protein
VQYALVGIAFELNFRGRLHNLALRHVENMRFFFVTRLRTMLEKKFTSLCHRTSRSFSLPMRALDRLP